MPLSGWLRRRSRASQQQRDKDAPKHMPLMKPSVLGPPAVLTTQLLASSMSERLSLGLLLLAMSCAVLLPLRFLRIHRCSLPKPKSSPPKQTDGDVPSFDELETPSTLSAVPTAVENMPEDNERRGGTAPPAATVQADSVPFAAAPPAAFAAARSPAAACATAPPAIAAVAAAATSAAAPPPPPPAASPAVTQAALAAAIAVAWSMGAAGGLAGRLLSSILTAFSELMKLLALRKLKYAETRPPNASKQIVPQGAVDFCVAVLTSYTRMAEKAGWQRGA